MTVINKGKINISLEIFPETLPVRGNALASGDDAEDQEVEEWILERLDSGDTWAWCVVQVKATIDGLEEFEGTDSLGGCSFEDEQGFKESGYYEETENTAIANLITKLKSANEALAKLIIVPKPSEITRVVFRKWKDTGDILALFPDLPNDPEGMCCMSYEHVGQHGGATYSHCIEKTVPVTEEEYASLKEELESDPYNYNLKVFRRCRPKHFENAAKLRDAIAANT